MQGGSSGRQQSGGAVDAGRGCGKPWPPGLEASGCAYYAFPPANLSLPASSQPASLVLGAFLAVLAVDSLALAAGPSDERQSPGTGAQHRVSVWATIAGSLERRRRRNASIRIRLAGRGELGERAAAALGAMVGWLAWVVEGYHVSGVPGLGQVMDDGRPRDRGFFLCSGATD